MPYMAGENRFYSTERRCKYKQLIVAETTTRASGSLLMPPDYAKVFGSKSVQLSLTVYSREGKCDGRIRGRHGQGAWLRFSIC